MASPPLYLLLAGAAALAALLLGVFRQDQTQAYCYSSVKTLSATAPLSANCFAVSKSGVFSKVFSADDASSNPKVIDGHVLPGLWDGHGHILQYGEMLQSVNLFGSKSLAEARTRIREYASKNPSEGTAQEWIRGIGWDQAAFGGSMPTADDIAADAELKSKFIMLDRVDVHCIWVSQPVLDLLPDPLPEIPGGDVVTEPGRGVFCDNAMDYVRGFWPGHSKEKKRQFLRNAMKALNKEGLVGMHDAGATPEEQGIFKEAVEDDDWTVRVFSMLECAKRNTFCPENAVKVIRDDGLLTIRSVKLFADGALGSWGSAMIEPYDDHPWTSGSLLVNASELRDLAKQWASVDFQVNIHAIGDLANHLAVEALVAGLQHVCNDTSLPQCQDERRFRIEHAQIIHPNDQKRIHEVGIIPSIQPTHATSDMYYAETRLGKRRTEQEAYRMRSLLPLKPILGSDFPVEPSNPFEGLYAAITRRSPHTGLGKDGSQEGWYKQEALSLADALHGFTTGPARGAFLDGKAGVIQEGAFADWIVLDTPIDEINTEDLRLVKVRETWVAGRRVYRRD